MSTNELSNHFEITPCDLTEVNSGKYQKMELTQSQKSQLSFAISQVPTLMASDALSKAYTVKFPKGITGKLMEYKTGGVGSAIMGEKGIVDHAAFYPLEAQAISMQIFSIMSLATGQHYLSEINNELKIINQKIDQILGFLYGEKKAELMAEISFVQYAYQNFSSIMSHESQRIATIASLQEAKKIAMKDIEFYLSDIDSKANNAPSSYSDFQSNADAALKNYDSLDMSVQLFVMSGLMEAYYSQNTDAEYIGYLRTDMSAYLDKCDKHALGAFGMLKGQHDKFKEGLIKKIDKEPLEKRFDLLIEKLTSPEKSETAKVLEFALDSITKQVEYCVTEDGSLYMTA